MIPFLTGLLVGSLATALFMWRRVKRANDEGYLECHFRMITLDKQRQARDKRFTETRKRMSLQ